MIRFLLIAVVAVLGMGVVVPAAADDDLPLLLQPLPETAEGGEEDGPLMAGQSGQGWQADVEDALRWLHDKQMTPEDVRKVVREEMSATSRPAKLLKLGDKRMNQGVEQTCVRMSIESGKLVTWWSPPVNPPPQQTAPPVQSPPAYESPPPVYQPLGPVFQGDEDCQLVPLFQDGRFTGWGKVCNRR